MKSKNIMFSGARFKKKNHKIKLTLCFVSFPINNEILYLTYFKLSICTINTLVYL